MKTSELRLGNLVQYGGTTAKVCQIEKSFFYCETDGNDFFTRDGESGAKPILLTEEWLLKLGFKKVGTNFELDFFVLWYSSYQNCFVWRFMNIDSNADRPISLEYVHQLQNLYFALTGEELTLKSE